MRLYKIITVCALFLGLQSSAETVTIINQLKDHDVLYGIYEKTKLYRTYKLIDAGAADNVIEKDGGSKTINRPKYSLTKSHIIAFQKKMFADDVTPMPVEFNPKKHTYIYTKDFGPANRGWTILNLSEGKDGTIAFEVAL